MFGKVKGEILMLKKTTHPFMCDAKGFGLLLALQPLALILATNTAQADPLNAVYEHTIGIPAGRTALRPVSK
jgi:hypothetical protein